LFIIKKINQWKTLFNQRKIWFDFQKKCFHFILGENIFLEVVKKLKISYYLLIITNLILKFFIAIYFVLNLFFSISPLRIWFNLIFILTLILIFMIVICFSLIIFLLKFFIYQIWSSFFWLLLILFEIIYQIIIIIIILISSPFNFFYMLDLISIILIVIYFIWDNLWD
jgi:hypothetical protein